MIWDKWLGSQKPTPTPAELDKLRATRILRFADRGLLVSYVGSIVAVYILDAIFFMAWAPTLYLIPVFLLIAITIRSCAVFSGPLMQIVARMTNVKREARTIRALSIAAGLLCLVPAMSFFAGGHHVQTHGATVSAATTGASDANKAERIGALEKSISDEEKGRDDSIAETNKTIDAIVNDDVPGISAADNVSIANLRTEIQKYRNDAKTAIDGYRKSIEGIRAEKEVVQTENAAAQTEVSPVYAIFKVVSTVIGDADTWALTILFFFALLVEALAFFGLGAIEGLRKHILNAIAQIEFDHLANAAHLEAQRLRQQALDDQVLAEINLKAAEAHARAEAIRNGDDADVFDITRDADRKSRSAEALAAAKKRDAESDERIAKIEADIRDAAARAELLRNPPPPPPPPAPPPPAANDEGEDDEDELERQRRIRKQMESREFNKNMEEAEKKLKVPTEDWRNRMNVGV